MDGKIPESQLIALMERTGRRGDEIRALWRTAWKYFVCQCGCTKAHGSDLDGAIYLRVLGLTARSAQSQQALLYSATELALQFAGDVEKV